MNNKKYNISFFCPAYYDEKNIEKVIEKANHLFSSCAKDYEIVIVNDGSPDKTGEIAEMLAKKYEKVRAVHHETNKGYGAAIKTGFREAKKFEYVCFTDGDDQYDVLELQNMLRLLNRYDIIISFRYEKAYSAVRVLISYIYNVLLRFLFRSPFRDISCSLKIFSREVIDRIEIESDSPFVDAEIIFKSMLMGFHIGEVGINSYPREFGKSTSTSLTNIMLTLKDIFRIRKKLFMNKKDVEKKIS
tara:strand:+ start:58 stop:792 length:735 start_codon:yes stop_codon:yes gene_type:complete